jgi:hypothetical protein
MEKGYNLALTEQELQIVFDALVEQPFKKVAPLVARIQAIYQAVQNSPKAEENPAPE